MTNEQAKLLLAKKHRRMGISQLSRLSGVKPQEVMRFFHGLRENAHAASRVNY